MKKLLVAMIAVFALSMVAFADDAANTNAAAPTENKMDTKTEKKETKGETKKAKKKAKKEKKTEETKKEETKTQ